MSEPIFDYTTESIYARLPDHFRRSDVAQNYALKKYISGFGLTLNQIEELIARMDYTPIEDGGVAGDTSDLVDPTKADESWLPWLAQLLGVSTNNSVVDNSTRSQIINASSGYRAGTEDALIAAVQSELVGTKSVRIRKRTLANGSPGGPWDLQILTLQTETLNNILPPSIIAPSSARNLELISVPAGYTDRATLTIGKDSDFYKSRVIEFRAVPQTSGIGSEPGDGDDGYGNDDFGIESFGTGDSEETGPTEFQFYTPFYFPLDGGDPLTSMVDVKYVSGTNDNVIVTSNIVTYAFNGTSYIDQSAYVGESESIPVGTTVRLVGRSSAIPAGTTHGRFLVRIQNVGKDSVIRIGHFGARKEENIDWVPRSADPVKAVLDRGAKPAGMMLHHGFTTSSWDSLEDGGTTTWDDLEAKRDWVEVEEYTG